MGEPAGAALRQPSRLLGNPETDDGVAPADSKLGAAGTEINIEQYGIYYDDLARIDGEWKFTRRLFVPVYINVGGASGHVLTQRSALREPE